MNAKLTTEDFEAHFSDLCHQNDLLEYMHLASRSNLSETEADRLEEILRKAESDEILNSWLNEVDYLLNQRLDLLNEQHIESYKDQQAWLREYLGSQKLKEFKLCRELQKRLKKKGCYDGPEDGVFGKDSQAAVEKFQQERQLNVDGKVGIATLMSLADSPKDIQKFITSFEGVFNSQDGGRFDV
ncbi:peptidoglycan-binding domain-containing protein [Leptolyngbya ohadii]|uniref:peptidoglycan-binding domain-containing protein n=1 Tax=Leptolyngbya ohadii TaxID=1962290 RepID=UPI000B59EB1C|nr:peptidoglycan-binding domain-containing protein [Leptolyngbya ohadii]